MESVPIQYRVMIAIVQQWAKRRGIALTLREQQKPFHRNWFEWKSAEDEVRHSRTLARIIRDTERAVFEIGHYYIQHNDKAAEQVRSNLVQMYPELEDAQL
jgi:hypothetical protein